MLPPRLRTSGIAGFTASVGRCILWDRPPREGFAKVKKAVEIVANYDLPNLAMESVLPGVGEKRKKRGGKK